MEMVSCVGCGAQIEPIEVFVGGICVECHAAKWEASEENFEEMVSFFSGGMFK